MRQQSTLAQNTSFDSKKTVTDKTDGRILHEACGVPFRSSVGQHPGGKYDQSGSVDQLRGERLSRGGFIRE